MGQVERNCRWLPSVTCAQRPRLSGGEVAQDIKTLSPHPHPSHHPLHPSHHHFLLCLSSLLKILCFLRCLSLSLLDNRCTSWVTLPDIVRFLRETKGRIVGATVPDQ